MGVIEYLQGFERFHYKNDFTINKNKSHDSSEVEQKTENLWVGGSNPPHDINYSGRSVVW